MGWLIALGIFTIWFIYMSTPEDRYDTNSRLFRFVRRLIFVFGDFYWLFNSWKEFFDVFPFAFGWKSKPHKISYNEVMKEAVPLLKEGDVALHRDDNYASNLLLGGAMVHAGIVVCGDDGQADQVIEALSEGVKKHHVLNILRSDRAVVLRPKFSTSSYSFATRQACLIAEKLVGLKYDILFSFSTKEDVDTIKNTNLDSIKNSGKIRMCCTEIPYVCYFDYIRELDIYLTNSQTMLTRFLHLIGLGAGEKKITADMYIEGNFDIVWCSKEYTVEWCEKQQMPDKYLDKIREYWGKK